MNDMVEDTTLEPFGVVYLHLRSQECPPVSERVPGKCPNLSFSVLGIERSVNMVWDITFKSLRSKWSKDKPEGELGKRQN